MNTIKESNLEESADHKETANKAFDETKPSEESISETCAPAECGSETTESREASDDEPRCETPTDFGDRTLTHRKLFNKKDDDTLPSISDTSFGEILNAVVTGGTLSTVCDDTIGDDTIDKSILGDGLNATDDTIDKSILGDGLNETDGSDDKFVDAGDSDDSGSNRALKHDWQTHTRSNSSIERISLVRPRVQRRIDQAKRTYTGLEGRLQSIERTLSELAIRVSTIENRPKTARAHVWF